MYENTNDFQSTGTMPVYHEPQPYTVNNVPVQSVPYYPPHPPVQQDFVPPPYPPPYPPPCPPRYMVRPADPGKDLAVVSLVLGIISFVFAVLFGGGIIVSIGCGIAAIITGVKSKNKSLAAGLKQNDMQAAGFIFSVIGLCGGIVWAVIDIFYIGFTVLFPILLIISGIMSAA